MKKILLIATIVIAATTTKLMAQEGRQQFNPEAMKERNEKMKAKMKEDLKLTDAQADSVIAVQTEFMPKMMGLRGLSQEERMAKIKEIQDDIKARLKAALKDEKLAEKVIEYQARQRREAMEKMREAKPQE